MESTIKEMFQIEKLNKSDMKKYIDKFLLIDKSLEILEKWDSSNYLSELPEKWQQSLYIHSNKKIIGYMICSKKEDSIHIHRLAVCKEFQGRNVGHRFIETLEDYIGPGKKITLKVKKFNLAAIQFYKKNGFIRCGEEDNNYLYEKIVGDEIGKKGTCNECTP